MENIELEAKQREKFGSKRSRNARAAGLVPAIVYGKGGEAVAIEMEAKRFKKIMGSKAGHNAIITLKIDSNGKTIEIPVLTHAMQRNAINDKITHVDFYKINMKEELKAKIPVHIKGEATGVKLDSGIMVQGLREVEIKCLPDNIPEMFEIDVTPLKIAGSLHASDIKLGKGITLVTLPTEILVTIVPPAKEEVEAAPITAPEITGQAVPVAGAAPVAGATPAAAPIGKDAVPVKDAGVKPAAGAKPAADAKKK